MKRYRTRRDYLVPPPGSKPMRSYVEATMRAGRLAKEQGRPVPVVDDRTGRTVYVARDAGRALSQIDAGWAHSIPKEELGRADADALVKQGLIRLVQTRKGWRWAITSRGSHAMGTFAERDRPGYFPKRRPPSIPQRRAKALLPQVFKLERGPERMSIAVHKAQGYVIITYPDRKRRRVDVDSARRIYLAHRRMGFRLLPSDETCECPAYSFPHRKGSGKCGDAHGGRRDQRRSTSGFSRLQREKVHAVMHEYKHGRLHSGSKRGPRVQTREQAIAIALSEARREARKRAARRRF